MTQYGFFIDLSRCTGCNACVIACKQWHDIAPGPVKWMRVYQWEKGSFPDIDLRVLPIMCFHCENPPCVTACPNGAIYKEPKYGAVLVNQEKCTGERKCWNACPYGTPQFAGDESGQKMSKCTMCFARLEKGQKPLCVLSCSLRALEFGSIDELKAKYGDVISGAIIPKEYSPCRAQCPIEINIEKYISLINEGKLDEAIGIVREKTPFAGVLGRVCRHPCEAGCLRGKFDDAVSICSLHRYLADHELKKKNKKVEPAELSRKESVAIIGSGPAGLSCAYDLRTLGYPVTVFESNEQSGGLLRYGIPAYELPRKILDYEIRYMEKSGVAIKTNSSIEKIDDLFSQGFKAVFIAMGEGLSRKMDIPGEDAKGVIYALDFIKQANMGEKTNIGKKVAVIGGGNVAIDAARLALRLGAKEVSIICLEHRELTVRERMPANDQEIIEAEKEGIKILCRSGVNRVITRNGVVSGLETTRCLSVYDSKGDFAPEFETCSESTLKVDSIIVAIGQEISRSISPQGIYNLKRISVNPFTFETNMKGIFAGGDAVTGPADVVVAIATGKAGAVSIDRYLTGNDLTVGRIQPGKITTKRPGFKSVLPALVEVSRRKKFDEVTLGLNSEEAKKRANQCLKCGTLNPSVLIRPIDPKKQIICWDANKALKLWQKRHAANGETLPDVINDVSKVTQDPSDISSKNKLVLKANRSKELLANTMDDE